MVCSNLFSKLFEIGEKLLKNPFSFFAVHKKGSKSNFLEQNTIFFCKRSSLRSQTFLSWFQTCWDTRYLLNFRTLKISLQKLDYRRKMVAHRSWPFTLEKCGPTKSCIKMWISRNWQLWQKISVVLKLKVLSVLLNHVHSIGTFEKSVKLQFFDAF